nr:DUF5931 domain-containing protein [Skermania sp. ID1734]
MRSALATDGVQAPLWRAAGVFRLLTLGYAVGYQFVAVSNYTRPRLSWLFIAVMAIWSGACAMAFTRNFLPYRYLVAADQVVVIGLMIATRAVAEHDWYSTHQTFPTTLWATNAVVSAAILGGPFVGALSGVVIAAVSAVVRSRLEFDLWADATAPILISVGLAIGLAANTARRAHSQLERATRLSAATAERERLAREVHDGVLQVLAYVRRRGNDIGGAAAELAEKAGEQEVALRRLISQQGTRVAMADTAIDLGGLLRSQASSAVVVSTPGEPVLVGRWVGGEIAAAVGAALANVELHAGPGAKAYVLLEDLGSEVIVSVRDDGVGMAPGRIAEARGQGRVGIAKSIIGRVDALGGTATVTSEPGGGTEWELRVPRTNT